MHNTCINNVNPIDIGWFTITIAMDKIIVEFNSISMIQGIVYLKY